MPQVQLPIFPAGVTHINSEVAFEERDGKVYYFNGHLPVFVHEKSALATFRLFSTQLVINGNATQAEISRAFGVPLVTVKRYVKLYREHGAAAFFAPAKKRSGSKLTAEVSQQVQGLLDQGLTVPEVGRGAGDFVQYLAQGDPCGSSAAWKKKDLSNDAIASTKSERSRADIEAPLGRATTRSLERVAASVGLLHGAPIEFELVKDVPDGGVLLALPALLLLGLLSKSREMFSMLEGFYPLESIFLLLALMALARVPSLEALRYVAPGEWGKLIGLDRIPEVRTLRQKITQLCSEQGLAERWSNALAKQWMAQEPECAGVFYADGHVRVYHGKLTNLPRRYIARERLCLRGTTDYWVNAMDGRPFFVVSCAVDPGLLSVLREQIVPRLKADVPNQPTLGQLEADPLLSRLTIVFDREGYSPRFFAQMKEERIAILTYHKFPGELWPEQEFRTHKVSLVNGEQVSLELAERGVRLSNDLWVREVRHLSAKGHQSSILSTDYRSDLTRVAVAMFARWCQEIFFKYMRQHYNLDRLIEYGTEPIPETTRVINPAWRQLDSQLRRQNGLLNRELLQFAEIQLPQEMEPQQVEAYQQKKGQLQQAIEERRPQIEQLKAQRKALPKHLQIKDLPEQDRFRRLRSEKKHFIDTIKLIAYRAETALAQLAREKLKRLDDARSLIRQLFRTEVDLVPDQQNKTLTVRLHPTSTQGHDEIVRHLCAELTEIETVFPGTDLRLVYEISGSS